MDGKINAQFEIRHDIKQVIEKYQNLKYWQNAKGDFVLQGLLAFSVDEKGHVIEDAFNVKILVPANYPEKPIKVWELCKRIPKYFHKNHDESLCIGTMIEIELALSDDNSLIEFIEQILIRYLFSFCVWEKTGKFPFGERPHYELGILDFYQNYFKVKTPEEAKRLLYYLSTMKRYSRKKWCPCRRSRRIRHCHGDKIKKLMQITTRQRFKEDYNSCKLL